MTDTVYPLGQTVTLTARFTVGGVLTDPSSTALTVRSPSGTVTTPTPDAPSTGVRTYLLVCNEPGLWTYRFEGTGAAAGVLEGSLNVATSQPVDGVPAYTYDLTTNVGKVRLYTDDHDFSNVDPTLTSDQRSAIFTDEELAVFLSDNGDVVYRAAAAVLRVISASRALMVQSRRIGETAVDYGSAREHLLKQATEYERLADIDTGGVEDAADGIAMQSWNDFSERRIMVDAWLRRS